MRKLVAVLVIMLSLNAMAATLSEKLGLGARFGMGLMWTKTDAVPDIYPSNGGVYGTLSFDFAYGLTDHFYLHSGIGLDYRNYSVYTSVDCGEMVAPLDSETGEVLGEMCHADCGYDGYEMLQQYFIEIPIFAQWRIPGILFVEGGVVLDFMVAKTYDYYTTEFKEQALDHGRNYGVSLAAAVGHVFDFGLFVDLRASYQLTDLVDADKVRYKYGYGWGSVDVDGNVESYYKEASTAIGSYYKLLKIQLGIGYWF
ncbi:Outer membrane protein beta-barrel domain-containing protein [Fibrobacter sp. UWH9]|uniref:outer membrane beta-barrel protein n=1 Tax=Fibrobacter sp. UWH9 TaxID=1896213 RepID=UPI0009247273|nr:outer membrane beta-barrel protein [Fibrobacter sp. UWH9]SHH12741.1 Outer membrane protein beta-barrel domain-containing protein [Fibrobacter sp. UWH9]